MFQMVTYTANDIHVFLILILRSYTTSTCQRTENGTVVYSFSWMDQHALFQIKTRWQCANQSEASISLDYIA